MATNKKPQKYKKPAMDALTRMKIEAKMKKENENARIAGIQYGTLAMGIISLMATLACSTVPEIRAYIIDGSEILSVNEYFPLPELIDKVNSKMGSKVTTDQLVEVDETLGRFF